MLKTKTINVSECKNSVEVLEKADLNWSAVKIPATYEYKGKEKKPNNLQLLVRDDTGDFLGYCTPHYKPFQNKDMASHVDYFMKESSFKPSQVMTAGSRVIVKGFTDKVVEVKKNDPVKQQISLVNSFDSHGALKLKLAYLRLVCANGLVSATNVTDYSFRHVGNIVEEAQQSQFMLKNLAKHFNLDMRAFQSLTEKEVNYDALRAVAKILLRKDAKKNVYKKELEQVEVMSMKLDLLRGQGRGNTMKDKFTAWNLYNAATEHLTHNTKKSKKKESNIVVGENNRLNMKVLSYLKEYQHKAA